MRGVLNSARLTRGRVVRVYCRNLLGAFGPCIVHTVMQALAGEVSTGEADGTPAPQTVAPMLTQSSVLALCKFMCISAGFCEQHLQVLFTVLQKASDAALRSTVVVALGDLAFRFPNLIEPWIGHMYDRLNDAVSPGSTGVVRGW